MRCLVSTVGCRFHRAASLTVVDRRDAARDVLRRLPGGGADHRRRRLRTPTTAAVPPSPPATGDEAAARRSRHLRSAGGAARPRARGPWRAAKRTCCCEGITCAACIWLNEQRVARAAGRAGDRGQLHHHRARVRWDPHGSGCRRSCARFGRSDIGPSRPATRQPKQARKREDRAALWRLFVAGFGMMQVMMYALPTYLADDGTHERRHHAADAHRQPRAHRAGGVLSPAARSFAARGATSSCAGWGWTSRSRWGSAWHLPPASTRRSPGAARCTSTRSRCSCSSCCAAGTWSMRARHKAAMSLEYLDRAIPLAAHRLVRYPASRDAEEVAAVSLKQGDLVLVKPGEVVPADGVLVDGETETDESLLTGESRPVVKRVGAGLAAGAVNRLSPAVMRVEQVGEATRASHIRRLTERAAGQRPHLVEITDRIAGWFVAGGPGRGGRDRAVLGRHRRCARAVDRGGSAGRHLPVRFVARHAHRAGGVGRQPGAARRDCHPRPRDRSAVARDPCGIRQDRNAHAGAAHAGGLRAVRRTVPARTRWLWPPRWSRDRSIPSRARFEAAAAQEGGETLVAEAVRTLAGSGVEGRIDGVVYRIGTAQFVVGAGRDAAAGAGLRRGDAGLARQRGGLAGACSTLPTRCVQRRRRWSRPCRRQASGS